MDETWVLVDGNSGLHVSWYFWLRVLDEVNRAARYGAPFGLLLLDADVQPGRQARLFEASAAYIPATIRSTDLGGILAPGAAAVLLIHQDEAAAEAARLRILERLAAACPRELAWQAKLLCYPRDAAEISALLAAGWQPRTELAPERSA